MTADKVHIWNLKRGFVDDFSESVIIINTVWIISSNIPSLKLCTQNVGFGVKRLISDYNAGTKIKVQIKFKVEEHTCIIWYPVECMKIPFLSLSILSKEYKNVCNCLECQL